MAPAPLRPCATQAALLRMVQSANALVCNVRPKATQRPGRGYEVLVGVNRNLVLFALLVRGIAVDGAVPLGAG